jgi:FMN phosphatase YigB (HAD superfamily)
MQALAPYRLVIFDCDGTLVDSQAQHRDGDARGVPCPWPR